MTTPLTQDEMARLNRLFQYWVEWNLAITEAWPAIYRALTAAPREIPREAVIKAAVDRFLGWKLPATFRPDAGISFKADYNEHTPWPAKHEPVGTNLFTADEARAMFEHCLPDAAPRPAPESAPIVTAQHDETGRMWTGPLDQIPARYAEVTAPESAAMGANADGSRGYALLGIGAYLINHSRAGEPPELVISLATEEEKAGRVIGDERDNAPNAVVLPESMVVRIGFHNVVGLDALEAQLRYVRAVHFASPIAEPTAVEAK